jgi:hypothetical protein
VCQLVKEVSYLGPVNLLYRCLTVVEAGVVGGMGGEVEEGGEAGKRLGENQASLIS